MSERTEAEERELDEAVARRLAEINADRGPDAKNDPDALKKLLRKEQLKLDFGVLVIKIALVVGVVLVLYWLFF